MAEWFLLSAEFWSAVTSEKEGLTVVRVFQNTVQ
jgi:hypothetical protein